MADDVSDYHKRCAAMVEVIRGNIGSGYGEGDIEHIRDVTLARLDQWDKFSRTKEYLAWMAKRSGFPPLDVVDYMR